MSSKKFIIAFTIVSGILITLFIKLEIVNAYQASEQNAWSEPEILFMLPDSVDGSRYLSVHVDNGDIILLSNYLRRTPDLHALEFSYVIRTNISENGSISEEILSDTNYPAEGSALLHHSDNGVWHTLWGERDEDPDFEMWETSLPRINLFSTSLMYRGVGIDETENSIEILDAGLLPDGGGAIRPPRFSIKIDESNNLHVVLQAWKFLEEAGGVMPFITYLRKKK